MDDAGSSSIVVESDAPSLTAAMVIGCGASHEQNMPAISIRGWELQSILAVAATIQRYAFNSGDRQSRCVPSVPPLILVAIVIEKRIV